MEKEEAEERKRKERGMEGKKQIEEGKGWRRRRGS